ncbi:hypothetical protein HJTV-2_gp34 [Haloarcula virus HJTV-2]|uniref:Uncharacterized protein n=1 Tax=Haloarcula virus HJTV-2 TaxID=2877986 RepID=A0AAE9BXB2_9CAUD|nr:hypothetical protein M1M33_gp113 [Haloarcula virus HJTV-2]UBF21654.1 hypothetical protein HJTV-2_gp34 [Haloarcula virus HJTV-2]UBF21923.1 hypothetical protein HJTV-3_gp34 [Haloarcula virus HJTV-3]
MVQEITVLVMPPGYDGSEVGDSRIDEVEVDPEIEDAYLDERIVPDEGSSAVDRSLVTDERKQLISDSISDYTVETSKDAPDPQVQLAALEKAVSLMWDVVSGEDVGYAQTLEDSESSTTDDSTSA